MDIITDPAILDLKSTTFSGRRLTRRQIVDVRKIVEHLPDVSRNRLCTLICEELNWVSNKGYLKIGACNGMLESLERQGVLTLPEKPPSGRGQRRKRPVWTDASNPQAQITDRLSQLRPLRLVAAQDTESRQLWNELVDRHHYLAYRQPFGQHIRYFVLDCHDRCLACLLFESSTPSLPARDTWIGWSKRQRNQERDRVVCNARFLILPWVKVRNLASTSLAIAARQITEDWSAQFKTRPLLLETFVDSERFQASCYRAANWIRIGETIARRNKPKKAVFVMPLAIHCRETLRGEQPKPKHKEPSAPTPKDARFAKLWRDISDIVVGIAEHHDALWQKRRRVFNSLLIILFVLRLVQSPHRQGYAQTLCELWEQCRASNIPLPQPDPPAASSITDARDKLNEDVFKSLNQALLARHDQTVRTPTWKGHRTFAVDGTKINLPRSLIEDGYKTPHDGAHYPQGLTSTLCRLHDRVPIDFGLFSHGNERLAALGHLQHLTQNDVVVYDRGYYAYAFLHVHQTRAIHTVFRIAECVNPTFDAFIASAENDRIIDLKPPLQAPPELKGTQHRLRLVRYRFGETEYRLATSLLDHNDYPIQALADLYHRRWSIEELYKATKPTIKEFHGKSERGVRQELYATFFLTSLSQLFAKRAEADLNQRGDPRPPMQVNGHNTRRLIGRSIEQMFLQAQTVMDTTVITLLNSIKRCVQRARPNRSYPRVSMKPLNKWMKRRAC